MSIIGWVDTDTIGGEGSDWPDAPEDAGVLASYLEAAFEQCVDYLPPTDVKAYPDPIPSRYKLAQIMQARATYNSVIAGSGDQFGPDGMRVTVYPMDLTVKNLLRPRRVGRMG